MLLEDEDVSPKHITGTATADEIVPLGRKTGMVERTRSLQVARMGSRASVRNWLIVHFPRGVTSFIRCVCRQRNHQPGLKGKHVS